MNIKIEEALKRLEKIREAKDKPQGAFAKEIGVTRESYNAWLSGRKKPSLKSWGKVREYLEE